MISSFGSGRRGPESHGSDRLFAPGRRAQSISPEACSNQPLDSAESLPASCCETSLKSLRQAARVPSNSGPFVSPTPVQDSPASPTAVWHRTMLTGLDVFAQALLFFG